MRTSLDPTTVRARLRRLVEADGRTRSAVAAAAGMSPSHLGQVLDGVSTNASVRTVGRILAALGRTWADLD